MGGLVQMVPTHATVMMLYSSGQLPQLIMTAGSG